MCFEPGVHCAMLNCMLVDCMLLDLWCCMMGSFLFCGMDKAWGI